MILPDRTRTADYGEGWGDCFHIVMRTDAPGCNGNALLAPCITAAKTAMWSCLYAATRETVEMTRRMSDAGADAVLVITPCFYKNAMNKEALYKHFHSVNSTLLHCN